MKKRQSDILSKLLTNDGVTLSELSREFCVTERTLRSDIREINELLQSQGNSLIYITSGKIGVSSKDDFKKDVLNLFKGSDYYKYKLSLEERKAIMSLIMIKSNGHVTINYLADKLSVSKSTIVSELRNVKNFFAEHNIRLVHKAKYGFQILGMENDIRELLFGIIPNSQTINTFSKFYCSLVENEMNGYVNRLDIRRIISDIEYIYKFELTDESFADLENYLIIIANRIISGNIIGVKEQENNTGYAMVAEDIIRRVMSKQHLDDSIYQAEVDELVKILECCNYIKKEICSEEDIIERHMQITAFVYDVCSSIDINNQMDFTKYNFLLNHIDSLVNRLINGKKSISNPLIMDLQKAYPEIFHEIETRIEPLNRLCQTKIDKNEISYIAMHLIAILETVDKRKEKVTAILVCSSGMCAAMLLKAKLKQNFDLEIVDILSLHKFRSYNLENIDLVISTVWIENSPAPYIQINPMLLEEDSNLIREALNSSDIKAKITGKRENTLTNRVLEYIKEYQEIIKKEGTQFSDNATNMLLATNARLNSLQDHSQRSTYLYELLDEDQILLDADASDWRESIKKAGRLLLQMGYIEDRYIDRMIEVVEKSGPYIVFVPGVAVAHAGFLDGSKKLGISLVRFKNPIIFNHSTNDPVYVVACLSVGNNRDYLFPFFNFIKVISDKKILQLILKAESQREIIEIIKIYEICLEGGMKNEGT